MNEVWADIQGYENKYQVSNLGNVRSLNYHRERKAKIMTAKLSRGYKVIGLRKDGVKKFFSVHRLVADAFIPSEDKTLQINHKNLNKEDNSVENLEWVSPKENTIHAIVNGRFKNSANKLRAANEKRKIPLIAINKFTGIIYEFCSIREAAKILNVGKKEIGLCLKGLCQQTKGFCFTKE